MSDQRELAQQRGPAGADARPHRRGLGRGLGSLIPTGPRPVPAVAPTVDRASGAADTGSDGRLDEGAESGAGGSAGGSDHPPERRDVDPSAAEDAGAGDAGAGDAGAGDARQVGSVPETEAPLAGRPADDSADLRPVAGARFAELPLHLLDRNPRQPREVFDEEALAELVHSVREVGLLQPVVVRTAAQGRFELVMGERRWRACREAGLTVIPAIIRETGDDALLRDALLENLHRADLNALEEAAAYQQLLDDFGCTHDELATRIGRSRPQISNTIRLLKLSPPVQRRVAAGVLSAGHARALLGVTAPETQDWLAARVVAEGISVRALEEIVAVGDLGSGPARPARRSRPTAPGVEDLAARLSEVLETRVKVDLGRRKGRITVEFASLPDLERIVALIDPGHPTRTRHDALDPSGSETGGSETGGSESGGNESGGSESGGHEAGSEPGGSESAAGVVGNDSQAWKSGSDSEALNG